MLQNILAKILPGLFLFLAVFAKAGDLTPSDLKQIIMSTSNLSEKRAALLVKQIVATQGTTASGQLNVSGLLSAKAWNYTLFKNRKIRKFDASFIPDGTKTVVTVPKLVTAEFFNGGITAGIFKEWIFIALPKNKTIQDLDGFETGRGISFSGRALILPFAGIIPPLLFPLLFVDATSTVPFITVPKGTTGVYMMTAGVGGYVVSSPKFKFTINIGNLTEAAPDPLQN